MALNHRPVATDTTKTRTKFPETLVSGSEHRFCLPFGRMGLIRHGAGHHDVLVPGSLRPAATNASRTAQW